jgi:hypothetical protein
LSKVVARIDRDYLNEQWNREGGEFNSDSRVGTEWKSNRISGERVRFRCLDDDGIPYYGGWLYDDPHSEVQSTVLEWTKADAGCTTIQIRNNSKQKWRTDIG